MQLLPLQHLFASKKVHRWAHLLYVACGYTQREPDYEGPNDRELTLFDCLLLTAAKKIAEANM